MSEHLPECITYCPYHAVCNNCCEHCICEELRAYEKRNASLYAIRAIEAEIDGFERGIKAARDAVTSNALQDTAESGEGVAVKVTLGAGEGSVYINRDRALAAIDALKALNP